MSVKAKKLSESFENIETVASQQTDRKQSTMKVVVNNPPAQQPSAAPSPNPEFFTPAADEKKPDLTLVPKKENPEEQEPVYKMSQQAAEISGKTGGYLISEIMELAFGLTERVVYINRFTADEKERLVILDELPDTEKTEKDHSLNRKFLAITKRHDKIQEKIKTTKDEKEAYQNACSEYARITGKTLDPQLIIWATIANGIVSKTTDIFL